MKITVYCGATPGDNSAFFQEAHALGAWIAHSGHTLVWGCGDVGLMGAVARGVLDAGGCAIGVIPRFLQEQEMPCADDYDGRLTKEITEDMSSRRNRMIELGEAFVALPGGPGTLDEISEVISFAKFDMIRRPIILMNVNGYYDALIAQLDTMVSHEFIEPIVRARISVAANTAEVATLLSTVSLS